MYAQCGFPHLHRSLGIKSNRFNEEQLRLFYQLDLIKTMEELGLDTVEGEKKNVFVTKT
jgi:hypothetical protein